MLKKENAMVQTPMARWKKGVLILSAVMVGMVLLCGVYLANYSHASSSAVEILENPQNIMVEQKEKLDLVFVPNGEIRCGLVFYPGGKVAHESYAPLMEQLAENGVLCVLLKMTGNLAVLEMNGADGVIEQYSEVGKWYLGGHSLGGVAASTYAADHPEKFRGVVLLGAYANKNLAETGLSVLSIYGSEDTVMNRKNYEKNKSFLPSDSVEKVIAGGIHAYFGDYGSQKGDGIPKISRSEQIEETVKMILEWIGEE